MSMYDMTFRDTHHGVHILQLGPVTTSVGTGDLLEGTPWGFSATRVSTESYISGSWRVSMDDMTFWDTLHGVHLLQPGPATVSDGTGDLLEGTPWGLCATRVSTESYISVS